MQLPEIHEFNAPNPKTIFKKNTGSHKLAYYTWGNPDSKEIVVCVHGLTRNGRDFDFLANALVKQGCYVIAVDVAGRGKSEHLTNPKAYGYQLYCADIISFFDELKLRNITYIGTSMGGLMGMMLSARDAGLKPKDRLISKLILNDIGSYIPKESLMRIGEYIAQNMEFANRDEAEKYYRQIMQPFGVEEESHWQHLLKHAFVEKKDGSCHFAYDKHIADAFWTKKGKLKKLPNMDFSKMWKLVKVPTFILRGADSDLLLKQTADKMAKSKNVEQVVEFANVGHAPMLMNDEQINVVLGFIKQN